MDLNIGNIGVWGAGVRWTPLPKAEALTEAAAETRRYEFLKLHRPSTVGVMRMNGTLEQYLREVDEQAEEMLYGLVSQMAKDEGVNETLKRQYQMLWVKHMNSIRNRAEEFVLSAIIYR